MLGQIVNSKLLQPRKTEIFRGFFHGLLDTGQTKVINIEDWPWLKASFGLFKRRTSFFMQKKLKYLAKAKIHSQEKRKSFKAIFMAFWLIWESKVTNIKDRPLFKASFGVKILTPKFWSKHFLFLWIRVPHCAFLKYYILYFTPSMIFTHVVLPAR